MDKAPERIFMFANSLKQYLPGGGKIMMGDTEYVRADMHREAIAALEAKVAAADALAEFMLTARDYVDDASKGLLLFRGRSMLVDMATEDLAKIDAALAAYRGAGK